jgi:hypothetical protein
MPAASCQGGKSMGGARALALLLKRLREKTRGLVDQPLPRPAHVRAAEHRLSMMAVHRVADPDLDAAVPKGGRRPAFDRLGYAVRADSLA